MKNLSKFITIVAVSSIFIFSSESFATERSTFSAPADGRGTSVNIPAARVAALCGDWDGCTIRLAMWNWDGTRRAASRESLFYLDNFTGNWRTEQGDLIGTLNDGTTQHVMRAWACHFTDGKYINWANIGDLDKNFAYPV